MVCCPVRCSPGMQKNHPQLQKISPNNREIRRLCAQTQLLPTDPTPTKIESFPSGSTIAMTDEAPDGADDVEAGSAGPYDAWWFCSPSLVSFQSFLVNNGELVIRPGSLDCLQRVEDLPTIILQRV